MPKHISFPRPEHPRGTCPSGQKRVLKTVNEKWKSQKLKKMSFLSSCEQTLGRILDLHKISDLLGQRNDVLQTLGSWRKLASMVWPELTFQFAQFFKGLKRGILDKIRCSQWLQGMVLDGIKGFQWKNSRSTTFNFKSDAWSCVLPLQDEISNSKTVKYFIC